MSLLMGNPYFSHLQPTTPSFFLLILCMFKKFPLNNSAHSFQVGYFQYKSFSAWRQSHSDRELASFSRGTSLKYTYYLVHVSRYNVCILQRWSTTRAASFHNLYHFAHLVLSFSQNCAEFLFQELTQKDLPKDHHNQLRILCPKTL